MNFLAQINVMPLKALLDPQGKAVGASLRNIDLGQINNVRIGKHITLQVEATSKEEAHKLVDEACRKLLHNPIMEYYEFTISQE
ncbi:MAG: phosphoribosylformylglycinamidine synthase subunit PurS [Bacteroidales bacterium]|jgi:phosphoribosylformylglycinamidine synthase|nr:phosphoribosylformylglycinamidine synthase subunit PurS [Bacteroidales bacterium]